MNRSNSLIEDSRSFFQKKQEVKILLEDYEKTLFEASQKLSDILRISKEMEEVATNRKALYFLHRIRRVKLHLTELRDKKNYAKKDFDLLYRLLDKIDENDSSDFLDGLLKGSVDRAAKSLLPPTLPQDSSSDHRPHRNRKKYFTFTFRGVSFLVPDYPKKIISRISDRKTHVRIGIQKFPIQPGPGFGLPAEEGGISQPTHLCILDTRNRPGSESSPIYRCFFFHSMDQEISFDASIVESRMKPLDQDISPYIHNFLRYAGKNYYILEIDIP